MTTGEKIRKLRNKAGLLQRELSEIIGYPVQTIGSWENDRTTPSEEAIDKLSDYFETQIVEPFATKVQVCSESKKCRQCDYLWGNRASGTVLCDYLYRTGFRRGCPAGDECIKFKPRKGFRTFGKDFKI